MPNSCFSNPRFRWRIGVAIWVAFACNAASGAEVAQPHVIEHPAALTPAADLKITSEMAAKYEKYGDYCKAIVDDARELRYANKMQEINLLLDELQARIEIAQTKSAEFQGWVTRREEFAKLATAKIVEIYANMRPEASAARLQQLDINLAASLLLAIPPRQASPILNEMDEKNAAAITAVMAASARQDDPS
ncbi:MAG: MotE family protein [Rhizobiaceae bacterium]